MPMPPPLNADGGIPFRTVFAVEMADDYQRLPLKSWFVA